MCGLSLATATQATTANPWLSFRSISAAEMLNSLWSAASSGLSRLRFSFKERHPGRRSSRVSAPTCMAASLARREGLSKPRPRGAGGVMSVMRSGVLVLLIVVLVILAALAVWLVTTTIRVGTEPVARLSAAVSTQIAEILHPTPTIRPDPVTIVREVRALARLETIQYTVEKVITAETGQGIFRSLFGDRLLFVAHGTVIAGVDLGLLEPEDVWFDSAGRVYLRLPDPEIFVATLDNERSYVYSRDTGLLTRGDMTLETAARQAAEDEIRSAALADGILDQARLNAENYLYRLLRSLGFPDVIFASEETPPTPSATPLSARPSLAPA